MDEQKHLKNEQGEPENKTEKSEYLFMQETIKDENSRGKKYRKDLLRIAGLGVAFGVCACISFSALRPWLDEKFPGDSQEVVIPEEKEEEKSDETTADTGNDSTVQTLGIDSYRELQKAMNSVASEAAKSVVEVIGISGEQDWTEESYDNKNSVSGLIIADNGQELLIYGKTSILRDTKEIHIRFADGTTKQASVKKKDESLGFAIYAVAKSSIAQSTWQQISIATLGSSGSVQKGDAAVVLGKPFGYAGAVGFGTIASSRNELDGDDGSYPLLCTDIGAAEDGTGVIINLSGEVVGIIDQGMRTAWTPEEFESAFQTAQKETEMAFADSTMYIEHFVENPRHIEFQILADKYGNVIHLGERDCSIQRNHQKLIEESPSVALSDELRKKMGDAAVKAAKAAGYENAGTIEFLLEKSGNFYFMEMNTRIQVEHPVTEWVTGVDLVKEQIRIASGQKLSYTQEDIKLTGHAIECRINAENPEKGFRPSPGTITDMYLPGGKGIRIDSAIYSGYTIPPYYDSMVAKLIVWAKNRQEAIRKMQSALGEVIIEGIDTNVDYQYGIVNHPDYIEGNIDIEFIERL